MKKLIVSLILFLCFLSARPQRTTDIGVRIGAAAYWGDIQNVDYSKSITPIYGVLGRFNFNKRMSVRGQLVTGNLKAYGTLPDVNLADPAVNQPNNDWKPYIKEVNNAYYFKRNIQTVEALFEFNFLDYQMGSLKKNRFTPFLSVGVGGFYSRAPRQGTIILDPISFGSSLNMLMAYRGPNGDLEISNKTDALSPIIPMGFGIKYNLTKRLGACIEFCVRKTFTDNIDNLVDPTRFQSVADITGNYPPAMASNKLINNDWYASLHLSLHWQIWAEKGNCKVNDPNAKYGKKSAF
ncbi:MAG TPA: DUF6089 family protein [Prolixibacteraceae bacterium]